jgi:hypothetical protein
MQSPRWLTDPMMCRPDARLIDGVEAHPSLHRLPRSNFWTEFLWSSIWFGEGFIVFQLDADGQPLAGTLRIVNPLVVGVEDGCGVLGSGPCAVQP